MGEIAQGSITALAVILTAISAWIQMLGGRPNGRIYYRLIFPVFFSASVIFISFLSNSFRIQYILLVVFYLLVTHLGHHTFEKRLLECCLYGFPAIFFGPVIFTGQMVLCVLAAVIGHFYKDKKAPSVELLVNFLRILLIGYMVS